MGTPLSSLGVGARGRIVRVTRDLTMRAERLAALGVSSGASVRVPVRLKMQFQTAGELRRCLLTNLSRGGVFVSTAAPPPIGTILRLRIEVAESDLQIEVDGEVVSTNVGNNFDTQHVGMGVRFVEPSPEAQRALDRLYEHALDGKRG